MQKEITQKKEKDFYSIAHLFVAAIRICEHRSSVAPSLADVCKALSFSAEKGNLICRKLKEMEIIEMVEGAFGDRLYIRNHLKLEDIPRGEKESKLEEELKKFQDAQKAFSQKIESFQTQQIKKKKDLFAEMEKKLKEELDKKAK